MSSSETIPTCAASQTPPNPEWLTAGGFVPVVIGVFVMFWGIAFICEEYGVPALTVFCRRNKISDHITGSIFIGTGLSLPVLFVALVGLFVSNSAIGVGAVVGGNIFNHCITIPTSVYVAPNRVLKLEPLVFTRELLCYFLSCLLLIWATQNGNVIRGLRRSVSSEQWRDCLSIPWFYSFILLIGYIAYCIINAYFDNFIDLFHYLVRKLKGGLRDSFPGYFPAPELSGLEDLMSVKMTSAMTITQHDNPFAQQNPNRNSFEYSKAASDSTKLPANSGTTAMISSSSNTQLEQPIDLEQQQPALIRGPSAPHPINTRSVTFAVSEEKRETSSPSEAFSLKVTGSIDADDITGAEIIVDIEDLPPINIYEIPTSYLERFFLLFTFPMKLAIYLTVPDVRRQSRRHRAILSIFLILIWLAIQSYILTVALTLLGNWWQINGAIMGLTVAAWASNYPAHWSSVVVARECNSSTADDIASCNVFGSNIFNNFIGLGLPWFLYSMIYQQEYSALQDQGVVMSLVMLMGVIVVHYVITAACGFTIRAWTIPVMVATYVGVIGYLCYFLSQF